MGLAASRTSRTSSRLATTAASTFVIAATEIVGGELAVCEGDAIGRIVARFPRTRDGHAAAVVVANQ